MVYVLKLLSENRESSDNQGGLLITQVIVYQNQVERALKVLKRQLNKDGLFKDLKQRRFYMKPSVKKKLKIKEAKKKRKAANRRSSSSWQL